MGICHYELENKLIEHEAIKSRVSSRILFPLYPGEGEGDMLIKPRLYKKHNGPT